MDRAARLRDFRVTREPGFLAGEAQDRREPDSDAAEDVLDAGECRLPLRIDPPQAPRTLFWHLREWAKKMTG